MTRVAILPAAGRSSRMGRDKLLLDLGDDTIIGHLVEALRSGGCERLLVVTAPDGDELRTWAAERGVETAVNPEPERGMLSTIVAGIDHLGGATRVGSRFRTVAVTPADVPGVRPDTVRSLIDLVERGGADIAVPRHRARRGHPLVARATLAAEISHLDPERGLRALLDRGHRVVELAVDDPGAVHDVDTPKDLADAAGASRER